MSPAPSAMKNAIDLRRPGDYHDFQLKLRRSLRNKMGRATAPPTSEGCYAASRSGNSAVSILATRIDFAMPRNFRTVI